VVKRTSTPPFSRYTSDGGGQTEEEIEEEEEEALPQRRSSEIADGDNAANRTWPLPRVRVSKRAVELQQKQQQQQQQQKRRQA
jgi:hypothetical protein